jgi:cytoskeletal protein CcmA (bactofilin family)
LFLTKKLRDDKADNNSWINGKILLFGDLLHVAGDLVVNHEFVGDIVVEGSLTLMSDGSILGDVRAGRVSAYGHLLGTVITSRLELKGQAVFSGQAYYEVLVCEKNVKVFNGTFCKTS